MKKTNFDVLIIGSGLAGLATALKLADHKCIGIVCKTELTESSSHWAQGGVAAAISPEDPISSHINDTKNAGAGLCDEAITAFVANNSERALDWLMNLGVNFTKNKQSDDLHLTREGGHSQMRIAHVADTTGKAIQEHLIKRILSHPNITVLEHHIAVDIITSEKMKIDMMKNTCLGAYVLNNKKNHVETFTSNHIVLATGGASKVYLYTTNPDVSTGDGIARKSVV